MRMWSRLIRGLFVATAMVAPTHADALERLPSFQSEAHLAGYLAATLTAQPQPPNPYCPPRLPDCMDPLVEEIVVTGSRITSSPSITNNQQAGVDEGDIVKMSGDTLIILRRGRLFTVDTSGGGLRAVDAIDAYPPGLKPVADDDWYDEMLVADDWVVVIGYSHGRGGTEINRFRLDGRSRLAFVDSHHLTSADYFSSRNYASRLVDGRLVIYAPVDVDSAQAALADPPELVRWRARGGGERRPLIQARDVHHAPSRRADGPARIDTMHVVTRCDLTRRRLDCDATAILGPSSRSFYVVEDAAYLWVTNYRSPNSSGPLSDSLVYRIPLDGSAPQAASAWGAPTDQLSFAEDAAEGVLRVLVTSEGGGDAMWRSDYAEGTIALLTLPLSRFGDGADPPDIADYRMLGMTPDNSIGLVNRFTDGHVLFASSAFDFADSGDVPGPALLTVAPLDGGPATILLTQGEVERIEPVGRDALVVSREARAVAFRTIDMPGGSDSWPGWRRRPHVSNVYRMNAVEGADTRSHAFFYQPDPDSADGERGVMGLPVVRMSQQDAMGELPVDASADIAFLRRGGDRIVPLGTLDSRLDAQVDDGCVASCTDWYGDARPIFVKDRILALLGYELVEGVEGGRRISELGRVNFAPPSAAARD